MLAKVKNSIWYNVRKMIGIDWVTKLLRQI